MLRMIPLCLVLFLIWGCNSDENPISLADPSVPISAAKALSAPSSAAVEWSCGADSVWSVYNGRFSFNIDRYEIRVRETTDQGRQITHRKHDATIAYEEGTCTLNSGSLAADSVTRIWKGYVWRDRIHRYYLQNEEGTYRLNKRYLASDGTYMPPFEVVRYRDFSDVWNRDEPRPADLTRIGFADFYPPINFSSAALDTLYSIPEDDRPFLESPFPSCGCMEEIISTEDNDSDQVVLPTAPAGNDIGGGSSSGGSGGGGSVFPPQRTQPDPPDQEDPEDDPEDPEDFPDELTITTPLYAGATAGGSVSITFRVSKDGAPLPGQTVSFRRSDTKAGADLSSKSGTTDADGKVSVTVSFSEDAQGSYIVEGSTGGVSDEVIINVSPPDLPPPADRPSLYPICDGETAEPYPFVGHCNPWPPSQFPAVVTRRAGAFCTVATPPRRLQYFIKEYFDRDGSCSRQECITYNLTCNGSKEPRSTDTDCISWLDRGPIFCQ